MALDDRMTDTRTAIVLLSGGYESTACAIIAKRKHDRVHAYFYDYGQPYVKEELAAAKAIAKQLRLDRLHVICLDPIPHKHGVFAVRNFRIIHDVQLKNRIRHCVYYFGCRAPLAMFDKYRDSNWQYARELATLFGITIRTPLIMWPKWLVKRLVNKHIDAAECIYSSEGFKYEDE